MKIEIIQILYYIYIDSNQLSYEMKLLIQLKIPIQMYSTKASQINMCTL